MSVGASRRFVMRLKKDHSIVKEVTLNDGDLLIMYGNMQDLWTHSVPKELNVIEPRVNLTFRSVKT